MSTPLGRGSWPPPEGGPLGCWVMLIFCVLVWVIAITVIAELGVPW